jgi:membrane-associated phospholipid phosphatase
MKARAAQAAVLLSLLFLVVYGTTNWLTACRSDVRSWYFAWERTLPFVPLLIVPYLMIDGLFLAAPFLCRDKRELRTLTRQITCAILAAGTCFLLLPLRFAFDRPQTGGWLGAVFDAFRTLDRPHNLFPSLHVALCVILGRLYGRHTRGWGRLAVFLCFGLIGLSTVLTYQHHVIDVAGGLALGWLCCSLFRERSLPGDIAHHLRIGVYYGLGSLGLLVLALGSLPLGSLLLWPALALGIVSLGYLGVGPRVYMKRGGCLAPGVRVLLAPVLLGQYLSLLYYQRRSRPWDRVIPGVLMGRRLQSAEAERMAAQGVTAVLDLTAEFSETVPFLRTAYRNVPILDLTAPSPDQLREAVAFMDEHARRGTVYVHCKVGYSRSAAVVGAYLLATGTVGTTEEAVACLRKARPAIVIRPEVWSALRTFEKSGGTGHPRAYAFTGRG